MLKFSLQPSVPPTKSLGASLRWVLSLESPVPPTKSSPPSRAGLPISVSCPWLVLWLCLVEGNFTPQRDIPEAFGSLQQLLSDSAL